MWKINHPSQIGRSTPLGPSVNPFFPYKAKIYSNLNFCQVFPDISNRSLRPVPGKMRVTLFKGKYIADAFQIIENTIFSVKVFFWIIDWLQASFFLNA